MEMNRYLIAALYVVAGCVATLPVGARGGVMSVGTDSYRLLVSPTEKVISIAFEQKSVDEIVPGKGDTRGRGCVPVVERTGVFYRQVVLPGWKVPEVSANPIRAPGEVAVFSC